MELDIGPIIRDEPTKLKGEYSDELTKILRKYSSEILSTYVKYQGSAIRIELVIKNSKNITEALSDISELDNKEITKEDDLDVMLNGAGLIIPSSEGPVRPSRIDNSRLILPGQYLRLTPEN